MVSIVYQGFTPQVIVPTYNIANVTAGVPIDVSQEVADDLTAGGTSTTWVIDEEE